MARAKRTDRAEARRRHRAAMGDTGSEGDLAETTLPSTASAPTSQKAATRTKMSSPAGKVSMGTAFRESFHPVDIRADFAALPWLAVHTKALWLPILLTVGGAIAIVVVATPSAVTGIIYQYFVQPPAIGGVFIAGFLAPRASWLLGVIVGLVPAATNAVLILVFPSAIFATAPSAAQVQELVVSGFLLSPVFGAFFGAGAAWYRRFLQLSNPNRGRRAEAAKRPGDGKTRSGASSQKSGNKR